MFLVDRIDHWAETTPDDTAVVYGEQNWTWAQWADRVHRVAGGLLGVGVRRGGRIAFLDKNNPASIEVAFAAGLLGASVAMVNWRLAGDELDYVINDSGATMLFVGAELLPSVEAVRGSLTKVEHVVVLGTDEYSSFADSAFVAQDASVTPDDVWLVMYSSGTTGRPKGVLLSHRNLVAHTAKANGNFPIEHDDHSLVAMPLFHVGGMSWAMFGIDAGATTTVVREADLDSLFTAFGTGVTHTFIVPALISGILNDPRGVSALSGLRYLLYGAAPMPLVLLHKALEAWPSVDFVQVYGQTELSGLITTLDGPTHRAMDHRLGSVGKPVSGAEVQVDDLTGELLFRSPQTMLGYLNHPSATAETISPGGWLRTGDTGHVDADGFVYISDRLKDMIITGGENVYSPEVERVVMEHPAVLEVAVIGVPDPKWGESVKAIVVSRSPVNPEEIIAFTRTKLAGYKCPRTVEFTTVLPRNPSGKVLKRDLRKPYWEGHDRSI